MTAGVASPRDRNVAIGLVIAFVVVCLVIGGGFGFAFGGALVPIGFLALAGLAVWWFISGERPSGSPATVVRRAAIGVALIFGCIALSVASFFASGLGGGVVTAAIVIAAGAGLVAGAFVGGARWLVLPGAGHRPAARLRVGRRDRPQRWIRRARRAPGHRGRARGRLPARRRRARRRPARARPARRRPSAEGPHRRRPRARDRPRGRLRRQPGRGRHGRRRDLRS